MFASSDDYGIGVLWIIFAAVLWATYALAQKQLLLGFTSMQIMFLIYLMGAVIFLPFSTPLQLFYLDRYEVAYLIFCSLNTLIAYGAFAEALEHWEASKVSVILATTPLVTIIAINLLALVWTSAPEPEQLNWLAYAGATGVVVGSAATALGKTEKNPADV